MESTVVTPSASAEETPSTKTLTNDCGDSPTRLTNSNTSSETESLPDEQEQQDALLSILARQLEYYFSPTNLARDTYLQTLQSLNDGYVPISIVANFAKVQAICHAAKEKARIQAVAKAAMEHTAVLEVVYISTVTNKKVTSQNENTILAVGPAAKPVLTSPKTPIQNTIILREVADDVQEEDVRGLFEDNQSCPPLQEVHPDVANCWFVTLDTTSRADILNVMLNLRQKTLKGEAVRARLKAAATPTSTYVGPLDPNAIAFPAVHQSPPSSPSRSKQKDKGKNKTTQKNKKPRRRKKSNANKQQPPPPACPKSPKKDPPVVAQPPPKLEEEAHFPALATPSVDNIVDKVGVEKMVTKTSADGASTATTASSATSSTSTPVLLATGGYAAALLKAAPPKTETAAKTGTTTTTNGSVTIKKSEEPSSTRSSTRLSNVSSSSDSVKVEEKDEPKEQIAAMPLAWGNGKSFAQVLKKGEESS